MINGMNGESATAISATPGGRRRMRQKYSGAVSGFKSLSAIATALLVTGLYPATSNAQFGFPGTVNLPQNDFRWVWGDAEASLAGRGQDFSLTGGENAFRCSLTGKLAPGSRLTQSDIRQLESQIQTSLYFIQSSANSMYVLDQQRDIDWAVLDCAKPGDQEVDAEERQAREDKARERAERKRDRRRAREAQSVED